MSHVNLNGYAFNTSLRFVFKPTGYLYSAFGGMIDGIPDFHKYKVVLMFRDPRDVLVSDYYSIAYSHPLPFEETRRKTFAEKRKKAIETSLHEFVRDQSASVKDVYNRYYNLLVKRYSIDLYYFTSYEAMTIDYSKWLKQLLGYLELNIPSLLFDALVGENERSRPVREDIHCAERLGRSSDYLNKLSPETIEWLNEDLKEVLSVFGYSKAEVPKIQSDG